MSSDFFKGMRHGIPIALGYLSVSFGFGILAVNMGLTVAQAVGISVTNLTSAGQVMGVTVIAAGGSLFEMALTQLVINLRYALMGLSLSRKLDSSFNTPRRMLVSYGITDEIFAVASAQPKKVSPQYMYGLILVSFLGWSIGTFIGAFSGQILPQSIINAMGIVLYGMFIAIVIPVAKRKKSVLSVAIFAAILSLMFKYVLTMVSSGFAIIISGAGASALGAMLFKDEEGADEE